MATDNTATLRAAVQALAALPALLRPYSITGTKLRVPKEIADPMDTAFEELRLIRDSLHYEGVPYGYQDEHNIEDIKKRCEGLGLTLFEHFGDDGDKLYIARPGHDRLLCAGVDAATADDLLDDFEQGQNDRAGEPTPVRSATPVQTKIESALVHIDQARRLAEVCAAAVQSLDIECSTEVALTMGNELWAALDEARKELERKEAEAPAEGAA